MLSAASSEGVPSRARPRIHFTAQDGWINDPYGITWVDGQYHMFYQAIPGRATWAPNCHWGHATSPDLVHWTEQPLAVTPQEFELGCWSGSLVIDPDREPLIFYTRISGNDWGQGKVAVAHGDVGLQTWTTGHDDVVVDGPPAELGVRAFRDPFVFRHADDWIMILAAGFRDGSGGALQYRSTDLRSWTYDGVLCSRLSTPDDEVWTGALWECPQLFPLGDQWVLLISVWNDDTLHYVAAGIGDYDGRKFTPRSWQRLTYGRSAYAMTAFTDRNGRRCVMSWLREEPQNNPNLMQRAGAHSIAATLSVNRTGQLVLQPHPGLDSQRERLRFSVPADGRNVRIPSHALPIEAELQVEPGLLAEIQSGTATRAAIVRDANASHIRVDRPGFDAGEVPVPAEPSTVRVIIDADLIEIFTAAGYGAFRIASQNHERDTDLVVGPTTAASLRVWTFRGYPRAAA